MAWQDKDGDPCITFSNKAFSLLLVAHTSEPISHMRDVPRIRDSESPSLSQNDLGYRFLSA